MKDQLMKKMIIDNNMLVYLHDVIALRDKDEMFYETDLYEVLSERKLTTYILGLRKTMMIITLFIITINLIKMIHLSSSYVILFAAVISVIFGSLFIICKREIKDLIYQLKLKQAVQFALDNYSYNEYVIFLDNYLSEQSSAYYLKQLAQ